MNTATATPITEQADRFRCEADVPDPPRDPAGRKQYWEDTVAEAVAELRRRLASGRDEKSFQALQMIVDLEKTRIRHKEPVAGTQVETRWSSGLGSLEDSMSSGGKYQGPKKSEPEVSATVLPDAPSWTGRPVADASGSDRSGSFAALVPVPAETPAADPAARARQAPAPPERRHRSLPRPRRRLPARVPRPPPQPRPPRRRTGGDRPGGGPAGVAASASASQGQELRPALPARRSPGGVRGGVIS